VHAYQYTREGEEGWAEAFARPGHRIPLPLRQQGESICFGADGKTLYLTSEKLPTPLIVVPTREGVVPTREGKERQNEKRHR